MNRRELLLGVAALPFVAAVPTVAALGDPNAVAMAFDFDPASGPDITHRWIARMNVNGNWECIASGENIPDIDAHMAAIADAAKAA